MDKRDRHFWGKRLLAAILCLAAAFSLAACTLPGSTPKEKLTKYTPDPENTPMESEAPVINLSEAEALKLAVDYYEHMSLQEKVGQLFVVNLEQLDSRKGSYYEFKRCTKTMGKTMEQIPVGGVILFSRNLAKVKQTKKLIADLQESSRTPLFVAVDEEGGDVARVASNRKMKTTVFPSAEEIGKNEDGEYVYEMGRTIAREIRALGFNVDFAPVADVRTSELNTEIGNRSFGDNPEKVASLVSAFVQGCQERGVSATLKHFPGQGSSSGDTHQENVDIDSSITMMRKIDFVPFQAGIDAGADFIMVSHISVSRVTETMEPASMSDLVMQTILREELRFRGVIVTDAFDMSSIIDNYTAAEAAYQSFKAGTDIILMPANLQEAYQGILGKVQEGTISEERLQESVIRILTAKFKRGILTEEDLAQQLSTTASPAPSPTPTASPKAKKTSKKPKKSPAATKNH